MTQTTAPVEHKILSIKRVNLGGSPIKGFPPLSGTAVRCSCGARAQFNNAPPSKGGKKWAEKTWFPAHVAKTAEQEASFAEAIAKTQPRQLAFTRLQELTPELYAHYADAPAPVDTPEPEEGEQ